MLQYQAKVRQNITAMAISPTAKRFRRIVDALGPDEFQILCKLFLEQSHVRARSGPIPGRDRKHDVYGTAPFGPFVALCTTDARPTKRSVLREIREAANTWKNHEELFKEIWFFTQRAMQNLPTGEDQKFINEEIKPTLMSEDERYEDNPPEIFLRYGPELAVEVAAVRSGAPFNMLRNRARIEYSDVQDEAVVFDPHDEFPTEAPPPEELRASIQQYNDPHLTEAYKSLLLVSVTEQAWPTLQNHPLLAAALLNDDTIGSTALGRLMHFMSAFSLGETMRGSDVIKAMEVIGSLDISEEDQFRIASTLCRTVFYEQPDLLTDQSLQTFLDDLRDRSFEWTKFLADMYLRAIAGYVFLSRQFLAKLENWAEDYFRAHADTVLGRVAPLIKDPLAIYDDLSGSELRDFFRTLAGDCEDTIDARWCVLSYKILMPLSDPSESEDDYGYDLEIVLGDLDPWLIKHSPFLTFLSVANFLVRYRRGKSLGELVSFERSFLEAKSKLLARQQAALQLEYLGSLHHALRVNGLSDLSTLTFLDLCVLRQPLAESHLFSNTLLGHVAPKFAVPDISKRSLFSWILEYARLLFAVYAAPLLKANHTRLHQFRLSSQIYQLREAFGKCALESLNAMLEAPDLYSNEYFARSCAVFRFCSRKDYYQEALRVLRRALCAGRYTVLRNARELAYCLYSVGFYGSHAQRAEASKLATRLSTRSEVGTGSPRLHWTYLTALKCREFGGAEADFLKELGFAVSRTAGKAYQLKMRSDETYKLVFPDEVIEVAHAWIGRGSDFAQILATFMSDPEVWNMFATTLMETRGPESDLEALRSAARFYSFAKCFIRERRENDQKYCYNYIRCQALVFKALGRPPGEFFILDTVRYLSTVSAAMFAYRRACTADFFDLIGEHWTTIRPSVREEVVLRIRKRFRWGSAETKRIVEKSR